MFSPRWQKLLRDISLAKGRTAMMIVAITVSVFGIGSVLGAYAILTREVSRNYLGTNPASATLELDKAPDDEVLSAVRQMRGIADAQMRASIMARVQIGQDEWRSLLLFVVDDFSAMRISTFKSEEGAWPPPDGTLLIERSAVQMVNARVGDKLVIKTPNGEKREVQITGLAHDTGLAPAWQERAGYGYITPKTLEWLGESGTLNELKITVSEKQFDAAAIERTTRELTALLQSRGINVTEIQIPPPGKHPHQNQMVAILILLLILSLMTLVLGAIMVATMINGLMAQQVRQIGVMKAVGAKTMQIAGMYIALILFISIMSIAIALPLGIFAGRGYASVIARLLNLTIYSNAIPAWVFVVQAGFGLAVPLLVALIPIVRISRTTVREAISDYGVSQKDFGSNLSDRLLVRLSGINRLMLLAFRNTFRKRTRLVFTLGLLAVAGGMFMTGLNVAAGWKRNLEDSFATRRYDLEIRLSHPEIKDKLIERIGSIQGVKHIEAWGYSPTTPTQTGGIDIVRTYPDKGHGSLSLRALPPTSTLVQFPLLSGRWLQAGDKDAIVLNQMALGRFSSVAVGNQISLSIEGRTSTWRVAGIVQEIGPAAAYVTNDSFENATGTQGRARMLRVVIAESETNERGKVIQAIERSLVEDNISVEMIMPDSEFRTAIGDHIYILIGTLLFMSGLMGIVGALGLTSTMSTSVVERTREFGVMRAIGAIPKTVLRLVVSEGVIIGLMSFVLAVVLALPLSLMVGTVIGNMAFLVPLPLAVSPLGLLLWLAVVIVGSAVASVFPAWRASRLTVRESLAYE